MNAHRRGPFRAAVSGFFAALMTLWVVDVGVNLALVERTLTGGKFAARLTDYLGLLLVESQLALAAVVLSGVGAVLVRA
ncbi:MAG: hypothetical protein ABIH26_07875, partial [Candidatus Eisenbacteria bacterium]